MTCSTYYSATTVSAATVSAATVSQQATVSQHTESLSQHEPCSVLLPHEAKETATIAANTNANFFILFCFLIIIQSINLLISATVFLVCAAKVRQFINMLFTFSQIFYEKFNFF